MSDWLSVDQRRYCMSQVHSSNTKPEVELRHALWRHGFRYRVNNRRLPGSPDIVLSKYRTVIFVHGCFWHGHKGCKKNVIPKTNTDFWVNKISRNQKRDQVVWRQLEAKGWSVVIVWECELAKMRFADTIDRVVKEIKDNGNMYLRHKEERKLLRLQRLSEKSEQKERHAALMAEIPVTG